MLKLLKLYRLAYKMYFKRATLFTTFSCGLRLLRNRIKTRSPVSIIIGITYACQCKCVHCGMDLNHVERKDEMTLSEIKALIKQARNLGVVEITLFGGEPLLHKNTEEIVSFVRSLGMIPTIDTNALLLTTERIEALATSGISCIKVSLDSPEAEVHDQLRGVKGCFEKAIAGLQECISKNIPCIISTYASKENLASGKLKELIELGRKLGVAGVRIVDTTLSGCMLSETHKLLTISEREQLSSLLEPGFVFLENLSSSKALKTPICPCIAKRSIYVSPVGLVQPCNFVPLSFGNVKNEALGTLIQNIWMDSLMKHDNCQCLMNNNEFRKRIVPMIQKADSLPVAVEPPARIES